MDSNCNNRIRVRGSSKWLVSIRLGRVSPGLRLRGDPFRGLRLRLERPLRGPTFVEARSSPPRTSIVVMTAWLTPSSLSRMISPTERL
jgi:hypothetical protein